jgi:hypothetical protein
LDPGLVRFLEATRDIDVPENILPFVYLKRADYERDPELVTRVTEALTAGDPKQFEAVLTAEHERAKEVFQIGIRTLRDWVQRRRLRGLNGLRTLLGVRKLVDEDLRGDLDAALWDALRQLREGDEIDQWVERIDANEVLAFSGELPGWRRDQLIEDYLVAFDSNAPVAPFHEKLLRTFTDYSKNLGLSHKQRVQEYLAAEYAQNEEFVLGLIRDIGPSLAKTGFVSFDLAASVRNNFSVTADEANRLRSQALIAMSAHLEPETLRDFVRRLNDGLAGGPPTVDANQQFALDELARLGPRVLPGASIEELAN